MTHPASGPISPEELKALADLPYGQAAEKLREHDPLWGRISTDPDDPEPLRHWKVYVTQEVAMSATVTVEARTEEEACEIAEGMRESAFSWDCDSNGGIYASHAEPK